MHLDGFYSSGQFAKMANVSIRTIRFYDKQNILKPSFVNESGARFYTDSDFARLQQILLLKYLGFALNDIKEMTIDDTDYHFMLNSLNMQKKLIQDKIEQMQLVESAIEDTVKVIEQQKGLDWSQMLGLIHLTNMEQSLKTQYQNAANISARIRLHKEFSKNQEGWFPWVFRQCNLTSSMNILELGCGNGSLWTENMSSLPDDIHIILSDISEGMLRDAKRSIGRDKRFEFSSFDCHVIPYEEEQFDLVIANHVLFYCKDIHQVCEEIRRVLKPGGIFLCSTYGTNHMKEISQLVYDFDNRIALSAEKLYEHFGLENGYSFLQPFFETVKGIKYEDAIEINKAGPLIEYILSCHGNQNQILLDRYSEFRTFVEKRTKGGFHITKDAGIFLCKKKK